MWRKCFSLPISPLLFTVLDTTFPADWTHPYSKKIKTTSRNGTSPMYIYSTSHIAYTVYTVEVVPDSGTGFHIRQKDGVDTDNNTSPMCIQDCSYVYNIYSTFSYLLLSLYGESEIATSPPPPPHSF